MEGDDISDRFLQVNSLEEMENLKDNLRAEGLSEEQIEYYAAKHLQYLGEYGAGEAKSNDGAGEAKSNDTKKPKTDSKGSKIPLYIVGRKIIGLMDSDRIRELRGKLENREILNATKNMQTMYVEVSDDYSLKKALKTFLRFRKKYPRRRFEIRMLDDGTHPTGWEVGSRFSRVPGNIGGGDYRGLQLDGADRWEGLRIVTPEVDVFYGKGSQYSVVVRDGVTSIGNKAFNLCTGLTSVTFPEGLTSIRYRAFGECSGLTSVTFPAGFTTIGEGAFGGCTGLTSLTFPPCLDRKSVV